MRRIDVRERPKSRSELAGWYSAALADLAASGLSVAKYADQLGVSTWTLYEWRRRLGVAPQAATERKAELVEVTVAQPTESTADSMTVRVCAGRRSIEVPHRFDADDLRRLVTALESC
jgi:transposase-like protein